MLFFVGYQAPEGFRHERPIAPPDSSLAFRRCEQGIERVVHPVDESLQGEKAWRWHETFSVEKLGSERQVSDSAAPLDDNAVPR